MVHESRDVFILGAGFSKAIWPDMPTMEDLSTDVASWFRESRTPLPSRVTALGNNIELWMTYLAQSQPWLETYENDYNRGLSGMIRKRIRETLEQRAWIAEKTRLPGWIWELIRQWHLRRSTVLTMNYDTLVERACMGLRVSDDIELIHSENIYPPFFANIAARSGAALWAGKRIDTFSFLKLHGSVNWYYSGRDDFYGETILYSDVTAIGKDFSETERLGIEISRDKQALIIPPVAEKSNYFNNETVRSLWRDAGRALREARRVFVIGYSLPVSDLGMRLFLTTNRPSDNAVAYVVDIDRQVTTRFAELWPQMRWSGDFGDEEDVVARFVAEYQCLET